MYKDSKYSKLWFWIQKTTTKWIGWKIPNLRMAVRLMRNHFNKKDTIRHLGRRSPVPLSSLPHLGVSLVSPVSLWSLWLKSCPAPSVGCPSHALSPSLHPEASGSLWSTGSGDWARIQHPQSVQNAAEHTKRIVRREWWQQQFRMLCTWQGQRRDCLLWKGVKTRR